MKNIRTDYLSESAALRPFYEFGLREPDWRALIQSREARPVARGTLVSVLRGQYADFTLSPRTRENLAALENERTFCITTGQQPGLFGGPLYVIYKALTAIKLADYLNERYAPYRFVPVFWAATEDHDFAEINHTYFNFQEKIVYKGRFPGAVGRATIDVSILDLFSGNSALAACFAPGRKWGEAFRRALHLLFDRYGLLILDPDDARLKAALSPVIEDEFTERNAARLVRQTSEVLDSLGYSAQVTPRDINLFYLTDDARTRIEPSGAHLRAGNFRAPLEFWRNVQRASPESFSPNVVLRPIYQELILPNLVYIGGWAEISYWLQLKSVFEHFKVFYPMIMPRASALTVPHDTAETVARAGLTLEQWLEPDALLRARIYDRRRDAAYLTDFEKRTETLFAELAEHIAEEDPNLKRHVNAWLAKNKRFIERLPAKIRRGLQNRFPADYYPLQRLKDAVQPDGYMQERTLNILGVEPDDPAAFVDYLFQALKLFDYGTQNVVYR